MLRSHRSLLDQLRSGILPSRLETGRFQNIRDKNTGHFRKLKAEERVCTLCNYSCGLSTSTIEYSSACVCVSVCVSVCLYAGTLMWLTVCRMLPYVAFYAYVARKTCGMRTK